MDATYSNRKIYKTYEKSILNEAKTGYRRKVQLLDDRIDEFLDDLEKKISLIDDNPMFQQKMYQMLANTTKEHSEFLMAMKRLATTLDSGAKTVPTTQGHAGNYQPQEPEVGEPKPGKDPAPGPENNVSEQNNTCPKCGHRF